MPGDHQTPEFRITEDARIATDLPVDLTIALFSSFLTAITFIGVLWSVGDSLVMGFGSLMVTIPGYLVISVVVYSILLSAGTLLVARHLVHVLEENKRSEAELRSIGTHLRECGEGTALEDDKKDGRQVVGSTLKAVIAIWRIYYWQLMRLTLITHASLLITPVVGLLLCTPKYLADAMRRGEVIQAAAAFFMLQGAFNWFIDNNARLAERASSANRVASVLLALDQIDRTRGDLNGIR
jgi:vitamin B12/bleomycin/antimicrobial peptide transport system ATP-binding/permease protein